MLFLTLGVLIRFISSAPIVSDTADNVIGLLDHPPITVGNSKPRRLILDFRVYDLRPAAKNPGLVPAAAGKESVPLSFPAHRRRPHGADFSVPATL